MALFCQSVLACMDRVCAGDDPAANSGLGRLVSVLHGHDLRFGHGIGGAVHWFMALGLAHRIAARTGVSFPEQAAKAKLNLNNRQGAAMACRRLCRLDTLWRGVVARYG